MEVGGGGEVPGPGRLRSMVTVVCQWRLKVEREVVGMVGGEWGVFPIKCESQVRELGVFPIKCESQVRELGVFPIKCESQVGDWLFIW